MNKALVYAKYKSARISAKKVAPVLDLVRGKGVHDARVILAFDPSKAAKMALKVLNSALANAQNNLKLVESNLYVSELHVSGGTTMKRGRPGSRLRFRPILKRTSHLIVGLSERVK